MKIAFLTQYDFSKKANIPHHLLGHFGSSYYMYKTLEEQFDSFEYIGCLKEKHSLLAKLKYRLYKPITKDTYQYWAEPSAGRNYANQISQKLLNTNADIVVSPNINLVAYLECKQHIILWTDSLYSGILNSLPNGVPCRESIKNLTHMDLLALKKCKLVIFSSERAAQAVIKTYEVNPSKIKVVPSGANIECNRTLDDIKSILISKSSKTCKLLFLGVNWLRKGGDIALEIAKELNKSGLTTELSIAGCQPISNEPLPKFVRTFGFIDRAKKEGQQVLEQLFMESHFLILPSREDWTPAVIREASSFGLPSISTNVGGIPTILRDNFNGKIFSLDASVADYCSYILQTFKQVYEYDRIAISSFNEYQSRLNWSVAGKTVKSLLTELL
ncbi:glycosyltransferase family 4 protein [Coleofasciculus sp. FACHB-64]|uniref:glycosyltransferase family 4 protein n=1 Tax=Cyanophyceae TaxID=3028117 RepID=UPI001685BCCE|nr:MULTISPECIES: glycosyltransferase [unclassified Coleofasciculus]MBD1837612.1 glycosyltransferase family 4 protein [Coleofasciculus sp. FACHB-501]MBD2048177.1 glycosyltransferase family 4 protein [Coleofasciculus sp. FACHB-64]